MWRGQTGMIHPYNSMMGSYLLSLFPSRSCFGPGVAAQDAVMDVEPRENDEEFKSKSIRDAITSNNLFLNSPNTF